MKQLLEDLDQPALKLLPAEPYVYAEWRILRAGLDYHVEVEDHYYSVPHRFAKDELEVRLTARTLEVFRKGERVAAHLRNEGGGGAQSFGVAGKRRAQNTGVATGRCDEFDVTYVTAVFVAPP